jgi:hypothetical protein
MNILAAAKDSNLFRPYLANDADTLRTWARWFAILRVMFGLPLRHEWQRRFIRQVTGRNPRTLSPDGYRTVLILAGRRSGKSKIAGLCASYMAALSGRESVCSPGELPMVSVVSPSRVQSRIIKSYARAALRSELLDDFITSDQRDVCTLENGVALRITTGSYAASRAYTTIAAIVDEICFFQQSEEARLSDTELIRSIRPSLLTTRGLLLAISTKYRTRGWAYTTWKKHFGNDKSRILVIDAPSRLLNPTLSEQDIEDEIAEDPASARAEFLNEWREDVQDFLPRAVVEACVIPGRTQLLRQAHTAYCAWVDVSGGRSDSMALSIGHKEPNGRKVVIDLVREWRAPCNPVAVVGQMAGLLQAYGLTTCAGDNYAAEFNRETFRRSGIRYLPSTMSKSELYLAALPVISAREIELPDNDRLITQFASLERKTRSGGRDSVDHPRNGRDDLCNVVAGVCTMAARRTKRVGGWGDTGPVKSTRDRPRERLGRFLFEHNAAIAHF